MKLLSLLFAPAFPGWAAVLSVDDLDLIPLDANGRSLPGNGERDRSRAGDGRGVRLGPGFPIRPLLWRITPL